MLTFMLKMRKELKIPLTNVNIGREGFIIMGGIWLEANIPALVAFRVKEGLSQRQLAKKCGVHYSTISLIEQGKRNPSPALGKKIARVLQVPQEAIFFSHYVDECYQLAAQANSGEGES